MDPSAGFNDYTSTRERFGTVVLWNQDGGGFLVLRERRRCPAGAQCAGDEVTLLTPALAVGTYRHSYDGTWHALDAINPPAHDGELRAELTITVTPAQPGAPG